MADDDLTISFGKSTTPPAHNLSMRDTMACVDPDGKIRCPICGRYARLDDMTTGGTSMGPTVIIHWLPFCGHCEEKNDA